MEITTLLNAIRGFSVTLESLEGKFKLSQDKKPADVAGVIAGLKARGDPASLAVAQAMKQFAPRLAETGKIYDEAVRQ